MIQEKINRAYESLMKLNNFKLPVKKEYAVYKLVQAADNAYQFALSEERKYLDEFHGTLNEDGNITFLTSSDCAAFKVKVDELCNMEVDIAIDVVKLDENDLGEQTLSPADIFNLEGFVDFT